MSDLSEALARLQNIRFYRRYAGLRELVSDVETLQTAYAAVAPSTGAAGQSEETPMHD